MYLKVDLDKVLTRADQVEVGKEYYLFNLIHPSTEVSSDEGLIVTGVTDDPDYPFESGDTAYCYAYPVPKKRPMDIAEIQYYWQTHKYDSIVIEKDDKVSLGFIIGVNFTDEIIYINDCKFTCDEFVRYCRDEDGNKFEIEED